MNTIKFYIPFEGFYSSIYDSLIDSVIEDEISGGYLTEDTSCDIDFSPMYLEMSEHIFDKSIELLVDELELSIDSNDINFDGLYSPKYYNYSTDKIKASCTNKVFNAIFEQTVNVEPFIDYVEEYSKSRSGFVSFYEGIEEVKKESSIYLEYLFQWLNLEEYRDELIDRSTDNIHEIIYNNL